MPSVNEDSQIARMTAVSTFSPVPETTDLLWSAFCSVIPAGTEKTVVGTETRRLTSRGFVN